MSDDGRLLALGALGLIGAAAAVRTRGSRGVARPGRRGPRVLMMAAGGSENRRAGYLVVVLDVARMKRLREAWSATEKKLGKDKSQLAKIVLHEPSAWWFSGFPLRWDDLLPDGDMDRFHDIVDNDGAFELPDGVFDSEVREPEMVKTQLDQVALTADRIYWTSLERFGDWPIESTSVDWGTILNRP